MIFTETCYVFWQFGLHEWIDKNINQFFKYFLEIRKDTNRSNVRASVRESTKRVHHLLFYLYHDFYFVLLKFTKSSFWCFFLLLLLIDWLLKCLRTCCRCFRSFFYRAGDVLFFNFRVFFKFMKYLFKVLVSSCCLWLFFGSYGEW